MPIFLLPVVVIVAWAVVYLIRTKESLKRARFLKIAGLVLMWLFSAFMGMFIVGDTFADPGGWEAAGYVAIWLVPLVLLGALAWFRPAWATVVFAVLMGGYVLLSLWAMVDPDGWRSYEDSVGPVRTVVAFAIAAPLALLGWKRPFAAGLMLVLLTVPPMLFMTVNSGLAWGSIFAVTSPATVTGILYLLAAHFEKASPHELGGAGAAHPSPA
jgi:hypothetical protein